MLGLATVAPWVTVGKGDQRDDAVAGPGSLDAPMLWPPKPHCFQPVPLTAASVLDAVVATVRPLTVMDGGFPALPWRCHQIPSSAPASAACRASDAWTASALPSRNRNVTRDRTMTSDWPASSWWTRRRILMAGSSPQARRGADGLRGRFAARAGERDVEAERPPSAGIALGEPGAAGQVAGNVPRAGTGDALEHQRTVRGRCRGRPVAHAPAGLDEAEVDRRRTGRRRGLAEGGRGGRRHRPVAVQVQGHDRQRSGDPVAVGGPPLEVVGREDRGRDGAHDHRRDGDANQQLWEAEAGLVRQQPPGRPSRPATAKVAHRLALTSSTRAAVLPTLEIVMTSFWSPFAFWLPDHADTPSHQVVATARDRPVGSVS